MHDPFVVVLATRNAGKVTELRTLLDGLGIDLRTAADFPAVGEVAEDAPTLEGNARKKALALYQHTGFPSLADDTGLEVAALDGAPGVHSARYAGPDADDQANRFKLLEALQHEQNRAAQFRTVLAWAAEGDIRYFEGICQGHIIDHERGEGGFGYDALFVPEGETRTFAEMDKAEKNRISHRGKALRQFAAYLRARLADR